MPTLFERNLNTEEYQMHGFLQRALKEFQTNMAAPRIMRQLAREHPWCFYAAAMHLLRSEPYSPGRRYLAVLLLNSPEVIVKLTDPGEFTRNDTASIFKCFMETDGLLDVKLAHHLPGRYGEMHALDLKASARMLDMLDQISPGRRLIPILGYLAQHPDPTIAAKAALLVSRRIRNPDWVKRHVNAKDPRIRANVVEGLWGADTSYVRPTYEDCLRDDNNRVVGNALVGMHLMGEHGLERRVISMAGDCRIPFRWTAAWVMGQVGKPENIPLLQKLMHDDAPGVRGAALRGLFAIRRMTTPKPAAQAAEEADSRVLMDVDEPAPQATPHKSLMLDGNSYRYRV